MFFFKQKTAYEMRISDWSSDVCSSDLLAVAGDHDAENTGACRLNLGRDDAHLGSDHMIDQSRLAGVWRTEDGNEGEARPAGGTWISHRDSIFAADGPPPLVRPCASTGPAPARSRDLRPRRRW